MAGVCASRRDSVGAQLVREYIAERLHPWCLTCVDARLRAIDHLIDDMN